MHYLTTILVELNRSVEDASLSDETRTAIHLQAREAAERAIERYFETAYDWFATEDAGRWAHLLPVVLLGAEDPPRFHHLLTEFAKLPLAEAKLQLVLANAISLERRSQEEFDNTPGAVVIEQVYYPIGGAPDIPEGIWSGIYDPLPLPDQNTLQALAIFKAKDEYWDEPEYDWWSRYEHLQKALAIASGQFVTEVAFYCEPDASVILSDEIREAAQEEPERFALVFLDMHM